jgi:hypothetical protein
VVNLVREVYLVVTLVVVMETLVVSLEVMMLVSCLEFERSPPN